MRDLKVRELVKSRKGWGGIRTHVSWLPGRCSLCSVAATTLPSFPRVWATATESLMSSKVGVGHQVSFEFFIWGSEKLWSSVWKRFPKGDHIAGHSLRPRATPVDLMSSKLIPVPFRVPLTQRGIGCPLSSLTQGVFRAAPGTGTHPSSNISLPKQTLSYSTCEGQTGRLSGRQWGYGPQYYKCIDSQIQQSHISLLGIFLHTDLHIYK